MFHCLLKLTSSLLSLHSAWIRLGYLRIFHDLPWRLLLSGDTVRWMGRAWRPFKLITCSYTLQSFDNLPMKLGSLLLSLYMYDSKTDTLWKMVQYSEHHPETTAKELGYADLKPEQLEVVETFVKGCNLFAVLPTGYGKSPTRCFSCI